MYTTFFKLSEKPFEPTPDPKFLYLYAGLREVFATLIYGIRERRGFIILVGEPGTGKTTLLNSTIDRLDSSTKVAFLFNMNLPFRDLLNMALVDLGVTQINEEMSKSKAIQLLNHFAIEQFNKGGNVVLILDEAQNLDPRCLENFRQLSNLETRKHKLIQIVLSGQPELETVLSKPKLRQLAQRIGLRCRTSLLSEKETYEYIQHRLHVADYSGPAIFSNKAKYAIWEYSKGIPRLINLLCDGSMLIAYGLDIKRINSAIVKEVKKDLNQIPLEKSYTDSKNSIEEFPDDLTDTANGYDEDSEDEFPDPSEEQESIDEPIFESSPVLLDEIYDDSSDASNTDYQNSPDASEETFDQIGKKGFLRKKSVITTTSVIVIFLAILLYFFKTDSFRSNDDYATFSAESNENPMIHESRSDPVGTKLRSNADTNSGEKNTDFLIKQSTSNLTETREFTRTAVKPEHVEVKPSSPLESSSQSKIEGKTKKPVKSTIDLINDGNQKAPIEKPNILDPGISQAKLSESKDNDIESSTVKSSLYGSSLSANSSEDEKIDKRDTMMVKSGENLREIIIRAYGKFNERLLNAVLRENPDIQNPNLIFENQIIRMPRDIEEN